MSYDTVSRYGIPYDVHYFDGGVKCVLPRDETNLPDEEALLAVVEDMQIVGCLERTTPQEIGFVTCTLYRHGWLNKGASDVYYNQDRNEFLKVPVVIKKGAMQFFAMNALSRALEPQPKVSAVRQRALVVNTVTRSTALFIEGASGTSAATLHFAEQINTDYEQQRDFRSKLADRVDRIKRQMPVFLRPLVNDRPRANHSLGLGNVFLQPDSDGSVDPQESPLTFIDQAHPSVCALLYHTIVRHL